MTANITQPVSTARIVSAEWDFEIRGRYSMQQDLSRIDCEGSTVHLSVTHRFAKAGADFPVLRVAAQCDGNRETVFARVQNLGWVRVVVKEPPVINHRLDIPL